MKKKIITPIIAVLAPLISAIFLSGCTSNQNNNHTNDEPTNQNNDGSPKVYSNKSADTNQDILENNNSSNATELTITSGCQGCGKCARLDPEHFSMSGHIAIVRTQNNLDSTALDYTIQNCPARAIVRS